MHFFTLGEGRSGRRGPLHALFPSSVVSQLRVNSILVAGCFLFSFLVDGSFVSFCAVVIRRFDSLRCR